MNNFSIFILFFFSLLYSNILTGLDVLESEEFKLLHDKKVGLVINHTSLNKEGIHILELLSKYENIYIKSIFTPEHGLKGVLSAGEKISNVFNKEIGVNIVSLYGDKREPDISELEGLDYIIFDIQDIGSRYYTYVSTLTNVLNVASIANIPVIVLDRPNPLGRQVSGPIISDEFYSFVGMHPIPVRHGMTIGELSLMINGEKWLNSNKKVDLRIIKIKNWNTLPGYFFNPPSPNIPNFKTALMYNGMCLFEGTNISEGRGTEFPFLLFGSPWMDSEKVFQDLIKLQFTNIVFSKTVFTPIATKGAKYPKYENELCNGIKLDIINSDKVNPLEVSISILKIIYKHYPNKFSFNNNNFIVNLYGKSEIKDNILNQHPIKNLINVWAEESSYFNTQRLQYLIY